MRPEDVTVDVAAQRFCGANGISLEEVRLARVAGQPRYEEGSNPEEGWLVVEWERPGGAQMLRLVCGPELHRVADVRLIDK
jgi:hypothetical protein